jgi:acetate---CoA ligase (ADP-forming)
MRPDARLVERFVPLFFPKTVAVVGASASGTGPANNFIRRIRSFGFPGAIYPIHPSASEIDGLKTFRSLAETPEPVDYAYVAISAERVPQALVAGSGRVRFVQVMSSGFGETRAGVELQARLLEVIRKGGMRLIGPNCLGTHSTKGRLTFIDEAVSEAGSVSVLSQSGGLAIDILRRGQNRGVRFASLVTLGNSADLGPNEMLDYLLEDPETGIIGLYLEDVADTRGFFERLRNARARKPVVLLKGGRSDHGKRAAASHTGMLAADDRLWVALARQTGTILVETLEEFLDSLVILQCVRPRADSVTQRIILFGNGGGTSVLGTDCLERYGFGVPALEGEAIAAMDALKLPAGSSLSNPIDVPAGVLRVDEGQIADKILEIVCTYVKPDALIMHLNMTVLLGYKNVDLLGNMLRSAVLMQTSRSSTAHFLLVLRSDGDAEVEDLKRRYRQDFMRFGIPVFDEIPNAARALKGIRIIEEFRLRHEPG